MRTPHNKRYIERRRRYTLTWKKKTYPCPPPQKSSKKQHYRSINPRYWRQPLFMYTHEVTRLLSRRTVQTTRRASKYVRSIQPTKEGARGLLRPPFDQRDGTASPNNPKSLPQASSSSPVPFLPPSRVERSLARPLGKYPVCTGRHVVYPNNMHDVTAGRR